MTAEPRKSAKRTIDQPIVKRGNGWSEDERKRQSERIRNWRPWERSTGPRTTAGKARTADNALKDESRWILRYLNNQMRKNISSS